MGESDGLLKDHDHEDTAPVRAAIPIDLTTSSAQRVKESRNAVRAGLTEGRSSRSSDHVHTGNRTSSRSSLRPTPYTPALDAVGALDRSITIVIDKSPSDRSVPDNSAQNLDRNSTQQLDVDTTMTDVTAGQPMHLKRPAPQGNHPDEPRRKVTRAYMAEKSRQSMFGQVIPSQPNKKPRVTLMDLPPELLREILLYLIPTSKGYFFPFKQFGSPDGRCHRPSETSKWPLLGNFVLLRQLFRNFYFASSRVFLGQNSFDVFSSYRLKLFIETFNPICASFVTSLKLRCVDVTYGEQATDLELKCLFILEGHFPNLNTLSVLLGWETRSLRFRRLIVALANIPSIERLVISR